MTRLVAQDDVTIIWDPRKGDGVSLGPVCSGSHSEVGLNHT